GHRFAGELSERRGEPGRAAAGGDRGGDIGERQRDHGVLQRAGIFARTETARWRGDRSGIAEARGRGGAAAPDPDAGRRHSRNRRPSGQPPWIAARSAARPHDRLSQSGKLGDQEVKTRRGFTLLEMMVATVILAVAIVGLLSGITGALRNAARLTEYDRAVQLARLRMNELVVDERLPRNVA